MNIGDSFFITRTPDNYLSYVEVHVIEILKTRYKVQVPNRDRNIILTFENHRKYNEQNYFIFKNNQKLRLRIKEYKQEEEKILKMFKHSEKLQQLVIETICKNVSISGEATINSSDADTISGSDFYLYSLPS